MRNPTRREFLRTASVTLAAFAAPGFLRAGLSPKRIPRVRVFVGSHTPNGILVYDWDSEAATLTPAGVAATVGNVAWLAFSHGHDFVYSASELDTFNDKPTGEVASFRVATDGTLQPLSARNSAGTGTCHVAVDATGQMLVAADYTGASAASFRIENGKLGEAVWTEHYTEHGPNPVRQPVAHAHFASFSPDNRFAYINDLGGDCIHIYKPNPATAEMTPAGIYRAKPGSGPRTLHFHPNGRTAYSMNELVSTVDVLNWHKDDGGLTFVDRIDLLPSDYKPSAVASTGCDTVISRDGRFVYFANRGDNFLYAFKMNPATGKLTPMKRSNCGGKTPRNFTLDPTERWMLVANQDSNLISVFARDPKTGELANEVKSSVAAEAPMRILFV
ncbi:MAG: lactonase family protein [Terracidiphilus sp.]|nr:lactonase family protein [Terracidiphilus sp.]MDR3799812.1 lactonase family protein [Terracidiphilus sp.]